MALTICVIPKSIVLSINVHISLISHKLNVSATVQKLSLNPGTLCAIGFPQCNTCSVIWKF